MDGLFHYVADYIRLSKDALDLARSGWALLPKSEKRDEAEKRFHAAEEALKRSDAALAEKLGYSLCQCTFPPQIMLWHEKERVTRCPRAECGRTIKHFNRDLPRGPSGIV